jgi:hypothetical protein
MTTSMSISDSSGLKRRIEYDLTRGRFAADWRA